MLMTLLHRSFQTTRLHKGQRNRRRSSLLLAALALPLSLCVLNRPVLADTDTNINSILSGEPTAPRQLSPAPSASASAPSMRPAAAGQSNQQKELWVKSKKPLDQLQIIGAHPLPSENCQQVIFDAHPSVKTRHQAKRGKTATFHVERLCLLGLRNGSDDRALVIRMGENFESLAISPNPELFTGLEIAPHQQINIAIRPLRVGTLDIPLEVTWKAELDKASPTINTTSLTIIGRK